MKKAALWTILVSLFIIPFLPLVVVNSFFFPFITGKNFAFRILIDIAVAAYALLAIADPKYRPRFSWVSAIYTTLAVWMFIADCFAVNPAKAFWSNFERMDGWVTLIHVFALFIIAGAVLSADKLWRKWWLTFVAGSTLTAFYGLFQLFGWLAIHQGSSRVDASLGNAAYVAAYLLFALAIAVWQGIESKGWLKWTLFAMAALDAVIIYKSETRGAVVGLIVGAFVAILMWVFESGKKGKKVGVAILVALVVIVGGLYAARESAFVKSDPSLARVTSISAGDLSVRFTIWTMAWHGFLERPVTGWGQEGFNYVFNKYYEPSMYAQEQWFDRAHNTFIDWLMAGGLPALLLFLALLGSAVTALYRREATRAERVLLVGAIVAYAVQALVVFDNLFTYVPLAMVLAMAHNLSSRPSKFFENIPTPSLEQVNTVVAPVVLVAGIALVWFVNVPNVMAATDLITALSAPANSVDQVIGRFQKALNDGSFADQEIREQAVQVASTEVNQPSVSNDDKTKIVTFAITEMQKEVALIPQDARLHLQLATAYRTAGDLVDARSESAKASTLSPKKQTILLEEGSEALAAGDITSAQGYFNKAYELDTSFADVAAYAAAGDILAGDQKTADALLISKFGTTTVDNNILQYAYYQTKQYDQLISIDMLRINTDNSAQNYFALAAAYVVEGKISDAKNAVEAGIANHPEAQAQGQQLLAELAAMK